MKTSTTKIVKKILIIIFWLLVWQLGALVVSNSIVLVGPMEVVSTLLVYITKQNFWMSILSTLLRISLGFSLALLLGILLGGISHKFSLIKDLFSPLILVIKSIPVASFVVILLIWAGASYLSFFISFLIVFPNIYVNTVSGLENTDKNLLKLFDDYGISLHNKILYLYKDSISSYILSGVSVSLGLAWKSGVAAEVIGLPTGTIGERLYMSKIYLDTAGLFSWTLVIVLLSYIFEKAVSFILTSIFAVRPQPLKCVNGSVSEKSNYVFTDKTIRVDDINISYGENIVFDNYSIELENGRIHVITGKSGVGKTTLLNVLSKRFLKLSSIMYQDDVLLEDYNVGTNIMLFASKERDYAEVKKLLSMCIEEDVMDKKIKELSGGMKRRVELVRTMLYNAPLILLDEPFTGLDEKSKMECINFIKKMKGSRTVVLISHDMQDVERLDAKHICLNC